MTASARVILFAPAAAATWRMTSAALPYSAASAVLESLYLLLLATAYSRSDTGFVYPIARGTAPVLVLAVSALALHGHGTAGETAGVLLVAAGIVLVRGLKGPETTGQLALAGTIGATIAGYTLVDRRGISHAAPLAYLETVLAITAAANLAGTWRLRGATSLTADARSPAAPSWPAPASWAPTRSCSPRSGWPPLLPWPRSASPAS